MRSIFCRLVYLFSVLGLLAATSFVASADTPVQSPFGKLEWRSVGPYIGGRVVAVTGVPGTRNLFYMGAVDGGVWRSTDYGVTWTNLTDGTLPGTSNSIGAIAVAPSNHDVIYVGTGESDIRGDVITGDGVYRSDDAGKTWKAAGLADTHTISALAVDPQNPDIVYASSMGHVFKGNDERGVFKSTDGGKTWSKVLFVNADTGCIDLVMDPKDPQTLYAAMWQAYRTPWTLQDGGPGSGLYKSTDGGAHWNVLDGNPGFPQGPLGRIGVTVAASNPQVVYSIVQAKDGGVFRSDDGGGHWTRVNDSWSLRQRAFYYMSIYADPGNPDVVYVPEVDALWVSKDGGKSFAKLHTPHGDNHIVWISPDDSNLLLEGNDGGATVSTNGGKTWSTLNNQPTGQFYHVALDGEFPFDIYGAQQDEGSFEGPSAAPDGYIPFGDWKPVAYGESTFIAPKPGDADITFGSGYYSLMLRYDSRTGELRGVSPWPDYKEGASAGEQKNRFGWTHPILFSAADPHELLAVAQYVFKSTDEGANWTRISPDLTRNDPATEMPSGGPVDLDQSGAEQFPDISALAVSPKDGKVMWAGSADGLVHLTTDGGKHWQDVTPSGLPEWAQISSIEPSYVSKDTAYLTASRYMWDDFHPYVFETRDSGKHWQPLSTGVPDDDYAFVVRQDPSDPKLLFLGTKNTVFVSLDGGGHWQPLTLNLPRVQVRDLKIDTREGELVAATHGRAFWVLPDLALLEQQTETPPPAADAAAVYAPQTAWLTHAYGVSDDAKYMHDVGSNPLFGATVYFRIPVGYDGTTPVKLSFLDDKGKLVRSFDFHLKAQQPEMPDTVKDNLKPAQAQAMAEEKLTSIEPGMNSFQWDLRYTPATEVKGFEVPIAAGGEEDGVDGPQALPGRYKVVLEYGGKRSEQTFAIGLDPRLHPGKGGLAARFGLEMQIHDALDSLNQALNQAIAVRDQLQSAMDKRGASGDAADALHRLELAIDNLVQLDIHSSEGELLHETKLRSHLAYLASDVGQAYQEPTAAQYAVFKELETDAKNGMQQLGSAIAAAKKAM